MISFDVVNRVYNSFNLTTHAALRTQEEGVGEGGDWVKCRWVLITGYRMITLQLLVNSTKKKKYISLYQLNKLSLYR